MEQDGEQQAMLDAIETAKRTPCVETQLHRREQPRVSQV